MTAWMGWPLDRFIYLFTGLAFALLWVQVGLLHWRGAFRHWAMWGPVLYAPMLAIVGVLFAFRHGGWLDWLLVIAFAVGALEGLLGVYYHFKGISHYIGGFSLRNAIAGPPPVLPIIFFALSLVPLFTYYWPYLIGGR